MKTCKSPFFILHTHTWPWEMRYSEEAGSRNNVHPPKKRTGDFITNLKMGFKVEAIVEQTREAFLWIQWSTTQITPMLLVMEGDSILKFMHSRKLSVGFILSP